MKNEKNVSREPYIDFLKGIAVFLVLWGHTIQYSSLNDIDFFEDIVFRIIYGFHMPLFMGISGYLFWYSVRKYSYWKFCKRHFWGIFVPMVLWSLVCGAFRCCLAGEDTFNGIIKIIKNSLCNEYWYLWALLINSLILGFLYNFRRNIIKKLNVINETCYVVICGCIVALALLKLSFLPARAMTLWLLPYFITGVLIHDIYKLECRAKSKTVFRISLTVIHLIMYVFLLQFFHKPEYIYISGINPFDSSYGVARQIEIDLFRWILGFIGIGFIMGLTYITYNGKTKCGIVCRGGNI